ncbi:MAG: pyridoxine 5'-phosphate synthase [Betaproteobacteria bacterium]|nr:pyridoxine 5'-phosphate synthase [Betaproteobacteria bacterium]
MTALSVNLNKIALVRNSRPLGIPSVTRFAAIALDAGADGITVHPRPDGRHIRPDDVSDLAELLTKFPGRELNIEGNPFHDVLGLVERTVPDQCTLVPDDPSASTSDHGWNLEKDGARLEPLIGRLRARGVRVSLFMDAETTGMRIAREIGADRVELYTEPFAAGFHTSERRALLERYADAAEAAQAQGLGVNAGHDLNRDNLPAFLSGVSGVLEVSIGHALTADALELGMYGAVRAYLGAMGRLAPGRP